MLPCGSKTVRIRVPCHVLLIAPVGQGWRHRADTEPSAHPTRPSPTAARLMTAYSLSTRFAHMKGHTDVGPGRLL